MSVEIMSKVWREAPYYGNKLLCLLACADWSNDEGEFYPSYNTIGKKIRITRRSAIRLLSSLVEDGTVSKVLRRNKSTNSSNLFKIHVEKFAELGDNAVTAKARTKKIKVVTPETLPSDTRDTRGSDSSVTHIRHVETSLDTSSHSFEKERPSLTHARAVEIPDAPARDEMPDRASESLRIGGDGALLCKCGDERRDHPDDGACKLNGLGHGIPSSEPENLCHSYRADKGEACDVHVVPTSAPTPPVPVPAAPTLANAVRDALSPVFGEISPVTEIRLNPTDASAKVESSPVSVAAMIVTAPTKTRKKGKTTPSEPIHPAIVLFRSLTNRYPEKSLWPEIITTLGETPNTELLTRCYNEWLKRGWNKTNLAWLFEWYPNGEPTTKSNGGTNGNGKLDLRGAVAKYL